MAGITALISLLRETPGLHESLSHVLESTYPLPGLKRHTVQTATPSVALGGNYPKHFQRSHPIAVEGNTTLLFFGSLYNDPGAMTEAEFVLRALSNGSDTALADLNGPFAAFAWDREQRHLVVLTDRLGRFPVFVGERDGVTMCTTDLHSLFNSGMLIPELDEDSVVDLLTVGFPLGAGSIFRSVERISGGEVRTFSASTVVSRRYWTQTFGSDITDSGDIVPVFRECVARAVGRWDSMCVALSGGWDSRATVAVCSALGLPVSTMTFGVRESTDVAVASSIAQSLGLPHRTMEPGLEFFQSFDRWTEAVVALSNGHATVDLAFQVYIFDQLARDTPVVLDSAGCEFRRGVRAVRGARAATRTEDITRLLLSIYGNRLRTEGALSAEFVQEHSQGTFRKLTDWLENASCHSFSAQIDLFSAEELWGHSYAHGFPLQTNFIACEMPWSDNAFYDLFLRSHENIRWSHAFHDEVIRGNAPALTSIPVSHGHCKVPYSDTLIRFIPVMYHRMVQEVSQYGPLRWVRSFDNYKPFRPYQRWYVHELAEYVEDTLSSAGLTASGYLDRRGVRSILDKQRNQAHDLSGEIGLLLTLAELVKYVRGFRGKTRSR